MSNIIRRYIVHTKFAVYMAVCCLYGYFVYHIPSYSFVSIFYHCIYGCVFCVFLFNFVNYVFVLLCLCILIVMYVLFCIFCFHHANWQSSATLTEVLPCFFLSYKANARVWLTKTGHGPHSSQLVWPLWVRIPECLPNKFVICVVLCTVCV